jgi:hypothetical protein
MAAYGAPIGILGAVLLFGLRHLPADLFYASAWNAAPQMWLCRQIQLYGGALLLGLARHWPVYIRLVDDACPHIRFNPVRGEVTHHIIQVLRA